MKDKKLIVVLVMFLCFFSMNIIKAETNTINIESIEIEEKSEDRAY